MFITKNKARNSLSYRMAELLSAIKVLRNKPELGELCFRVYLPDENINSYRASLEEEAKDYGYNIYFKSGKTGTTLGMLKDVASEYWE